MLFNSLVFAVFLPLVFSVYWFALSRHLRLQNLFLLVASYVFYGWWDWRFLSLIFLSSAVDYAVGVRLAGATRLMSRRLLLATSLTVNLGALGFFKYFDFFADSFTDLIGAVGFQAHPFTLNVILPVGISFYTFQTLSYTIDVYRGKIEPTRDPISFFAFVSFFPQLVAGPIERASNLLPQFQRVRRFDADAASDGTRQILWGLFKKIVVADTCAGYVNDIFANYQSLEPGALLLGAVYFAFQIYGDFSGYSDIAIGTARLFGFRLMRNFAYPYFSRDIAEFWRRWHISLSSWFRDYLYIPMGGSRVSRDKAIRNILIVFVVSGFWHGANWTFLAWGLLNGLYFIPLFLRSRNRKHLDVVAAGRVLPTFHQGAQMLSTFALTVVAWIFFRSPSIGDALQYLARLFSPRVAYLPSEYLGALPIVLFLVGWEWMQRDKQHGLAIERTGVVWRQMAYVGLTTLVVWFFRGEQTFIYFQF